MDVCKRIDGKSPDWKSKAKTSKWKGNTNMAHIVYNLNEFLYPLRTSGHFFLSLVKMSELD